jgi:cystathionine beta-lyase
MKKQFDIFVSRNESDSKKWGSEQYGLDKGKTIPMWIADMDFQVCPAIVSAMATRLEHPIFGYAQLPDGYNDSIVKWHLKQHQYAIDASWICFSPGVVTALSLCVEAYTRAGDGIIIQTPVYYPFERVIKNGDRRVLDNALVFEQGQYHMDFELLRSQAKHAKMMFLCSPHNPVGRVWTSAELNEVAKICHENNVLLISDEVHSELIFKPNVHTSIGNIMKDYSDQFILCHGASKTFNIAGLKTSTIIIPNAEKREAFSEAASRFNIGTGNIMGYYATMAAYTDGEAWLEALNCYLEENLSMLLAFFKIELPAVKVIQPEGTYLIWIDCHALGLNDEALDAFCKNEAHIAFDPGIEFGMNGSGFMRMNIACPQIVLKQALLQLKDAIKGMQ